MLQIYLCMYVCMCVFCVQFTLIDAYVMAFIVYYDDDMPLIKYVLLIGNVLYSCSWWRCLIFILFYIFVNLFIFVYWNKQCNCHTISDRMNAVSISLIPFNKVNKNTMKWYHSINDPFMSHCVLYKTHKWGYLHIKC